MASASIFVKLELPRQQRNKGGNIFRTTEYAKSPVKNNDLAVYLITLLKNNKLN